METRDRHVANHDDDDFAPLKVAVKIPGLLELEDSKAADDRGGVEKKRKKLAVDSVDELIENPRSPKLLHKAADDDDDVILIESPAPERVEACLVCQISLDGMPQADAQLHVNGCLDKSIAEESKVVKPQVQAWKQIFAQAASRVDTTVKRVLGTSTSKTAIVSDSKVKSDAPAKSFRECPFYKKMPGTSWAVDAFNFGRIPGITGYFLSHFHADHYMGLSSKFDYGLIYCSAITAKLVMQQLRVPERFIRVLPMNESVTVDGHDVTLIDANHCPGSVLFLFTVKMSNGRPPLIILHTGDFRASKMHLSELAHVPSIDILYLDTTYCKPQYRFPAQESMTASVANLCIRVRNFDLSPVNRLETWAKTNSPTKQPPRKSARVLYLVGTYLIGKERVFMEIARQLQCKVYADKRKKKILSCQVNEFVDSCLTEDPRQAEVHVIRMIDLKPEVLVDYLKQYEDTFDHVLAFRPTGWSFSNKATDPAKVPLWLQNRSIDPELKISGVSKCGKVVIISVPYSEHSSFSELEMFVKGLKCKRVIPTVNVATPKARDEMQAFFTKWGVN